MTMDPSHRYYRDTDVLVTGGAGCIGSNLIQSLATADATSVTVVDDLSSSFEWNLPEGPTIKFVKGDILDDKTLDRAFSSKPEVVFHLAAHFANQNSVDHPEQDLMVNGLGTLKLLRRCKSAGVGKFVFASSGCSVYGSQAPLPLTEDYVSIHLDTPYQITKLLGELYCNFYVDYYELPVAICRYFNVYGPGEVPGMYRNVIPNFFFSAIHREPLHITGTGRETRDFTYVGDIVRGTLLVGANERAVGQAFNLASGTETAVERLARMINSMTDNPSGVTYGNLRSWDKITRRRAAIEKAHRELGYEPLVSMKDGLAYTHSWFKSKWNLIQQAWNDRAVAATSQGQHK